MTPQTALELEFADGTYTFDLKLPQLAELQEKCGATDRDGIRRPEGIGAIYARLLQGRYLLGDDTIGAANEAAFRVEDVFETIRLGLIGGGAGLVDGQETKVDALRARSLVERYCHAAPLKESWTLAAAILGARFEGYSPPKKAQPDVGPATRTKRSTSRKSSRTAPSSAATGAD